MLSCVFCAIVSQQQRAPVLCESEQFVCFAPLIEEVPGHTIIATKAHYQSMLDAPASLGSDLFIICKKLADHFKTASGAQGFNLLNANESVAQQSVMHLHFHFLPRHSDDAIDAWPVLPGANQYVRKSG
jgi:histidine triad (HIT) family protein